MNYYRHKLEKEVNDWLFTNYENQQGKVYLFDESCNEAVPYCHGDFIEIFLEELIKYLLTQNYNINNVNSFKDDMIRFFYKHTHDKRIP